MLLESKCGTNQNNMVLGFWKQCKCDDYIHVDWRYLQMWNRRHWHIYSSWTAQTKPITIRRFSSVQLSPSPAEQERTPFSEFGTPFYVP